ncbi:MAG TPA: VOC family protein [Solirubrobacteraceae bacterium]|jgi:catechol 2,3-dioxygenase-like lactoylglutathione lyase family enzyme|nr:VOC family protein [Solirubrobacteraceae bacterium]
MSVSGLAHVLVLSDDIDATCDFYRDVVGLRVGPRPPLRFPGYWLYADGPSACLHVAERGPYLEHAAMLGLEATDAETDTDAAGLQASGGALDHIAFAESDYEAVLARIQDCGVTPVRNAVPGGPRQLFVDDPNGVRVEINVK